MTDREKLYKKHPMTARTSLYKLNLEWAGLVQAMEESDGELDEELEAKLDELLDGTDDAIEQAAGAYLFLASAAAEAKARENSLGDRRRSLEGRAHRVKGFIATIMEASGTDKVHGAEYAITLRKALPVVEIEDETAIPADYLTSQKPKVDKRMILADLKAGKIVTGTKIVPGKRGVLIK